MTIIDEVHNRNRPMPEIFTRKDIRNTGGWDVGNVRAVRGEPYITVGGRIMRVPLDDSQLAKAIRAHEQIHVKVSPQDLNDYINEVTGEQAIRAAEEARVNYIASQLGFPMKAMETGSEKFDGEMLATQGAWEAAVFAVAAAVHTGSLNPLLVGIRRIDPVWADSLRNIAKEIVAFQNKQIREIKRRLYGVNNTDQSHALSVYGNTAPNHNSQTIVGMNFTIELAMLLESIAALPAPTHVQEQDDVEEDDADTDEADDTDDSDDAEASGNGPGGAAKLGDDEEPEDLQENKDKTINRKDLQKRAKEILNGRIGHNGVGDWLELNVKRMPMSITVPGAIGRKRVATNMGRNPRRMHRLITDPEKRIFDKYVKASGGVILIDCSGSMSLSKEDVRELMVAAPGCTVLAYSAHWRGTEPNCYILGEKGKICNELPKMGGGNGNDMPAIQYAVKQRQNAKAPVVWVTDGMVYRPRGAGQFDEIECAKFAQKNRVHMEFSPQGAIDFLNGLKRGNAYKPNILPRWKEMIGLGQKA